MHKIRGHYPLDHNDRLSMHKNRGNHPNPPLYLRQLKVDQRKLLEPTFVSSTIMSDPCTRTEETTQAHLCVFHNYNRSMDERKLPKPIFVSSIIKSCREETTQTHLCILNNNEWLRHRTITFVFYLHPGRSLFMSVACCTAMFGKH